MRESLSSPVFWTWDHSANWKKNEHGKQVCGCNNPYTKSSKAFIEDYTRMILWAEENGIGAVGAVALLRDCHGGVQSARYLADFAAEHNVTLYLIAGLGAYSGIYFEGDSPWNLDNFLRENPECRALNADGSLLISGAAGPNVNYQGCFSKPKMRDYVMRSVEWLFKEISSLGGIAMETGDTKNCMCPECRKRRQIKENWLSTEDMAMMYSGAVETIRSVKPDAMIICETYQHFLPSSKRFNDVDSEFGSGIFEAQVQALSQVPKDVYFSWVADGLLDDWKETDLMPEALRDHGHIMRAHYGTQWSWAGPNGRHRLELENVQRMCHLSACSGVDKVSLFGESSVYNTNNELNYLAQIYFSHHPEREVDNFLKDVAANLLGGYEAACIFHQINKKIDKHTLSMQDIDAACSYVASLTGDQRRRWVWLSSYISSIYWDDTELIAK